jgi:hypothetical protein
MRAPIIIFTLATIAEFILNPWIHYTWGYLAFTFCLGFAASHILTYMDLYCVPREKNKP